MPDLNNSWRIDSLKTEQYTNFTYDHRKVRFYLQNFPVWSTQFCYPTACVLIQYSEIKFITWHTLSGIKPWYRLKNTAMTNIIYLHYTPPNKREILFCSNVAMERKNIFRFSRLRLWLWRIWNKIKYFTRLWDLHESIPLELFGELVAFSINVNWL